MSFPLSYRATMTIVAEQAMDKKTPRYVQERLLRTLVQELSPLNPRHAEVKRELGIEEESAPPVRNHEQAEADAYMRGVRDTLASLEEVGEDEDEDGDGEDEPP